MMENYQFNKIIFRTSCNKLYTALFFPIPAPALLSAVSLAVSNASLVPCNSCSKFAFLQAVVSSACALTKSLLGPCAVHTVFFSLDSVMGASVESRCKCDLIVQYIYNIALTKSASFFWPLQLIQLFLHKAHNDQVLGQNNGGDEYKLVSCHFHALLFKSKSFFFLISASWL